MSTVAEIEAAIEQLPLEQLQEVATWLDEHRTARTSSAAISRTAFRDAIGSYYRDYPDEPVRDSATWLKELRAG
jgi:hypothetical protein